MPIYPQVVAWVETVDGRYLGTIYVTGKGEKNSWISAPSTGRPEALPVWNHLKQGELDSVSAATSAGETLYESSLAAALPAGDYIIKLETNRSYDDNAAYTTDSSGGCGQPSLVYRASLTVGHGPAEASFEPIDTAMPLALALYEALSNALLHAFPGGRRGHVAIGLCRPSDGEPELSVIDDGIGLPFDYDERRPYNAGMSILSCLSSQLGGALRLESRDPGLAVYIAFPVERRESFDARIELCRAEPIKHETIVMTVPVAATRNPHPSDPSDAW